MSHSDFIIPRKRAHAELDHTPDSQLWDNPSKQTHLEQTDICISQDKIQLIKSVIQQSSLYFQNGTKLLFLSGSTGCGKSTLIRLLCQTMSLELVEWEHPARHYDPESYISPIRHFEQFIYGAKERNTINRPDDKKIILVDDLPDMTTPQVKRDFQAILTRSLNHPMPSLVVIVISHAWMSSERKSYDTKLNNLMDIIPQGLEEDRRVKHVRLNPANKTLMNKALQRVISGQDLAISKAQLDTLIEFSGGDIRLAINHLQFYPRHDKRKKHEKHKKKEISFEEKIGPLDLFHAVGKVLYSKRRADGTYESRPEHIFDKLPTDPDYFNAFLHQNSLAFYDDIEAVAKSFDYLSLADTLRSQWDWQDHHAAIYRSLVTMYGLMEKPAQASHSFYQIQRPDMFDVQAIARQKRKDDYHQAWMASVASRYTEETEEMEPIEDFTDDEFEAIDDDDDALALLMDQY
ncbi:Rad17 cell cycle checkpoint protein-domain-containing protein [Blakeslea trispora]|nr:Rad17 cell cycle checkpoint protein-domain-containing protein [Blakeslea trispora]